MADSAKGRLYIVSAYPFKLPVENGMPVITSTNKVKNVLPVGSYTVNYPICFVNNFSLSHHQMNKITVHFEQLNQEMNISGAGGCGNQAYGMRIQSLRRNNGRLQPGQLLQSAAANSSAVGTPILVKAGIA